MEKVLFKDVPVAKQKLKGSLETLGKINYHYQKYDNTFKFFDEIMKNNRNINKIKSTSTGLFRYCHPL